MYFPDPRLSDAEGLVAVGGDISPETLLQAYRQGIFPWYNDNEPICWWSPEPRCVLFPDELKISKSMRTVLNNGSFRFTTNRAFAAVMNNCRNTLRNGIAGSWINQELIESFNSLHGQGYAHSAEAWADGILVGGLYGIRSGDYFFGESMFSKISNASKFAFIKYIDQLKMEGVKMIDCQVYTPHLESLGARMIPRNEFLDMIG